ncbi:MAG: response regulator [Chthoniobacterales bacterium]|nr:response regulator [Chthoniobacterales bacterium]
MSPPLRGDAALRPLQRASQAAPAVIALLALVLVGAIWALAWERVGFTQRQALEAETSKNDNLAIAHAETMQREIELVDQLLRLLRDDLQQRPLPRDLGPRVAASGLATAHVLVVSYIDASGDLAASTLPEAALTTVNFRDRDYFGHHAAEAEDRPLVGVPVLGRLTGQWVISVTRRVEQTGGGFGGVLYAAVDPAVFARLYGRSALRESGTLALIGLDGMTRVRRNGDKVSFGGDVRRSQLFQELQKAREGHYTAKAASDGVRRTLSFRQLGGYPLVVVVESSLADVQAQTHDTERAVWAAAGGSSLLVLAMATLAAYAMQRSGRAIAALAEAEQRHRLLLDNSFDAILRTAPDGRVLAANAAACALFGRSEDELRAAGRSGLVDTDDLRLPAMLAQREATGRASGRLRMRRADGSLFEAEVNSIAYTDTDGAAASSLTVRDLSAQLAAEAERGRFEQRLRESQKLESIGTLAGGIAHDFNNILAAILVNAALLRQELGSAHPGAEALSRIDRSALRGRSLVQQILTFSRRNPEQREAQPLQPLLLEAAALLCATLPAAVRLDLDLPELPLAVVCDATQMQQVLMNMCTNAWQAMPGQQGRIDVTLRAESGPAGVRCAVLRVHDDGQGIDAATRERLFEPFFTTKAVGQGTGLGLAVVHGIVTAHGGSIAVQSTPGAGSTFEVRLPLSEGADGAPSAPAVTEAAAPIPTPGRGERVLYVDDDEVLAITVESLLLRAGWRARTCAGAAQALALLRSDPAAFDLVVTDYNMPEMSGLDLAAELHRLRPALLVVITSGHVDDELLARAGAVGVRQVMPKEYTLERLVPLVQQLLASEGHGDGGRSG